MPQLQPNDPRRGFRTFQQRFDIQSSVFLERVARDIRTRIARLPQGIGGQVRAAQLNLVLREISIINERLWNNDLLNHIDAGTHQSRRIAESAMETLNNILVGNLPPDLAQAVSDSLSATARAGFEALSARVPRALSDRVWNNSQLANGKIEDLIRSGIAQGLSAKEFAQTVYQFASPRTPGGQGYAAMRLARTEINNAFHEQQKAQGSQIGVLGTKWNLSGSHPKPDECDEYAAHIDSGLQRRLGALAKGVWKVDEVPNKPHPHCFCFMSYVTLSPKEFATAMLNGQFDNEIDRRARDLVRSAVGG